MSKPKTPLVDIILITVMTVVFFRIFAFVGVFLYTALGYPRVIRILGNPLAVACAVLLQQLLAARVKGKERATKVVLAIVLFIVALLPWHFQATVHREIELVPWEETPGSWQDVPGEELWLGEPDAGSPPAEDTSTSH